LYLQEKATNARRVVGKMMTMHLNNELRFEEDDTIDA
jgi:ribosome-binding factor A